MNQLSVAKRVQILGLLLEGMSLRGVSHQADASVNTVSKLWAAAGAASARYQDKTLRNLPCQRVDCDEIWSLAGAREMGKAIELWTWTARCAETKLMVSWMVAPSDREAASAFTADVASRLLHRVPLNAGRKCGADRETASDSTRDVERVLHLPVGLSTWPLHVASRKVGNYASALALHFMWHNFGQVDSSLRVTPAMAAGIAHHIWSLEEVVALADAAVQRPAKRRSTDDAPV